MCVTSTVKNAHSIHLANSIEFADGLRDLTFSGLHMQLQPLLRGEGSTRGAARTWPVPLVHVRRLDMLLQITAGGEDLLACRTSMLPCSSLSLPSFEGL